jgi:hypothetical protein
MIRIACFLGVITWAAGAALPPAEQWLPTHTVAFASVPDARAARASWASQSPGRLWADPAMAPFRAHLETEARRLFWEPIARLTGFQASALADLAEGQATIAWVDESGPRSSALELRQVLLLEATGREAELEAWFERRDPKVPGSTASIQGINFLQLSLTPEALDEALRSILPDIDEAPARGEPRSTTLPLWVGRRDALLLASTSSNALAQVLLRLAEPPRAEAPTPPTPAGVILYGNLVVPPFLRSLSLTPLALGGLASPDDGPSLARIAAALGLNQIRQASFSVRSGPEGWYTDFRLAVPPSARTGLLALFSLAPQESGPPPFIPADAERFARARFSGPGAWSALEKIVRDIDPAFLGVLQLFTGYAGKTEDADFDFQKGVIDLLGDDWMTARVPTGVPKTFGNLMLVGSPKPQELLQGFRRVASPTYLATFFPPDSPAPQRWEQRVHGQQVTTVSMPPMPWLDGATGAVHFAQRHGYVAMATDLGALAGFLGTNPPPALAQQPNLRETARRAGGTGGGYFSYADEKPTAARFFAAFAKSSQALSEHVPWIAFSPTATRLVAGMEAWIEPGTVPPFSKVESHFGTRITTARMTPAGLEWTTFRPLPRLVEP